MLRSLMIWTILLVGQCAVAVSAEGQREWRVGVARENISPELPIWLSGYAARNRPAPDKLDDLWAKALVLQDAAGRRAVLVTMDLIGIDRELSQNVCRRIEEQFDLPREAIALSTSHTHSGPVVRGNLEPMYVLNQRETSRIDDYTAKLEKQLVSVVGAAIESLQPARLSWGTGTATFAVNRRNNPEGEVPQRREAGTLIGPVDHDLPVLAIHGSDDGTLRAVVCGYACHATTLDDYQLSGDWPGASQNELERRHPGAVVLFWAGCGGDQNPVPRRSVDWVHTHGRAFADGVDAALAKRLQPIEPTLTLAYDEIDLPFGALPTREHLESVAAGDNQHQARWAKYLLEAWDRDGGLPESYRYPVQVWHLGPDITWIFLGGEVVVDYALRLKSELGRETTWVAGYSNDVMGYIASQRVLAEGGYEGGDSRWYYGLPAVWSPEVEPRIVEAVHRLRGGK